MSARISHIIACPIGSEKNYLESTTYLYLNMQITLNFLFLQLKSWKFYLFFFFLFFLVCSEISHDEQPSNINVDASFETPITNGNDTFNIHLK